jgi:hypothetical protein
VHFVTEYLCLPCDSRIHYALLGVRHEWTFAQTTSVRDVTSAVPFAEYHEISYRSPLQKVVNEA